MRIKLLEEWEIVITNKEYRDLIDELTYLRKLKIQHENDLEHYRVRLNYLLKKEEIVIDKDKYDCLVKAFYRKEEEVIVLKTSLRHYKELLSKEYVFMDEDGDLLTCNSFSTQNISLIDCTFLSEL